MEIVDLDIEMLNFTIQSNLNDAQVCVNTMH
ncbi:hypothetical protein R078138_00541 [Convivina praedatoris]|uniref:Uncharacterized protein n=1 Tax=Convivina praedatoris TaxID=2880963 RepID=A0ABM9D211_9LACO|nr:hypothetical protein LMG032447_00531 [Convivina sp. LMG 32447]CAH1852278.1 hypothetical protein R078138_00541 [Convivina sp. LMG 32447]CAH1852669.1 hypothetical protein R077815_00576 [Convivina sp. LMG 32447]